MAFVFRRESSPLSALRDSRPRGSRRDEKQGAITRVRYSQIRPTGGPVIIGTGDQASRKECRRRERRDRMDFLERSRGSPLAHRESSGAIITKRNKREARGISRNIAKIIVVSPADLKALHEGRTRKSKTQAVFQPAGHRLALLIDEETAAHRDDLRIRDEIMRDDVDTPSAGRNRYATREDCPASLALIPRGSPRLSS